MDSLQPKIRGKEHKSLLHWTASRSPKHFISPVTRPMTQKAIDAVKHAMLMIAVQQLRIKNIWARSVAMLFRILRDATGWMISLCKTESSQSLTITNCGIIWASIHVPLISLPIYLNHLASFLKENVHDALAYCDLMKQPTVAKHCETLWNYEIDKAVHENLAAPSPEYHR